MAPKDLLFLEDWIIFHRILDLIRANDRVVMTRTYGFKIFINSRTGNFSESFTGGRARGGSEKLHSACILHYYSQSTVRSFETSTSIATF